jgi:hypothetical protein
MKDSDQNHDNGFESKSNWISPDSGVTREKPSNMDEEDSSFRLLDRQG